jgi:biopolymer transport protein ExbB
MVLGFVRSKARVIAVLLALALLLVVSTNVASAQTTAPAAAAAAQSGANRALVIVMVIVDLVVIFILLACSIAGIALAIDGLLHVREARIAPVETTEHLRSLINARQFKELMDFTTTDQSFVSQSLNAGLRRAHLGYPAMREALESATGEQTANMFRRIEFLNIIGNIGPLIGLMGTVVGMIKAFYALAQNAGSPDPGKLAEGIATALWHTFFGLLIAIPALIVFGYLRTRADKIATAASMVSEELLESLRPAEKGGAGEHGAAAKPAPRRVAPPPAPAPAPAPGA